MKDEQLLTFLKAGGRQMEKAIRYMYRWRKSLSRPLIGMGAAQPDAEDVFQEAIQILVYNVHTGKYEGQGSLEAYLVGVGKNLWRQEIRKKKRRADLMDQQAEKMPNLEVPTPEDQLEAKQKKALLANYLSTLQADCRKILGYWSLGYTMKEITKLVPLKNENTTRQKKHQCMKKWVQLFHDNPDLINPFLNDR